jgi:hypothetical protein
LYERRLKLVTAAVVGAIPYAVSWLPVMISQAGRTDQALAWLTPPTLYSFLEAALMQGGVWWLLVPALLKPLWRGRLDWLPWALAMLVPFALSFVKPVFWARFTVASLPAFAIAAARSTAGRHAAAIVFLAGGALHVGLTAARNEDCDSRWTARWLAQHTRPGDTVIFTNLSRLATMHYWKPAPGISTRSFPEQIDTHPGYEGRVDPAAAEAEARALATQLGGRRVYILHGFNPAAHESLLRVLNPKSCHECTAAANYYRRISVVDVP